VIVAGFLVDPIHFVFQVGKSLEKELSNIGQGSGVACCDAALREGLKDLGENVVDVGAVVEFARKRGKLSGERFSFEKLGPLLRMQDAKRGVAGLAEHAAAAAFAESAEAALVR
jgi:hypothetical protein